MRVKLGEANELKFSLTIKGSTSDPAATQPKIRFMVTETKTGTSMCFPMEKLEEEGTVSVTIPPIPALFHEGSEYTGQVEVIVGNRWFNPTTVGLVFEREMEVEAKPLLSEQEETRFAVEDLQESTEFDQGDDFSSVIKPEEKQPLPTKKNALKEKQAMDVLFQNQSTKPPVAPVLTAKPSVKPTAHPVDPSLLSVKNSLKRMISEAMNELK